MNPPPIDNRFVEPGCEQFSSKPPPSIDSELDQLRADNARLVGELKELQELHNMQLAGISTASLQNTESTVKDRINRDNPYWTVAYGDVCVAVDREMKHRNDLQRHKDALMAARVETERLKSDWNEYWSKRYIMGCVNCTDKFIKSHLATINDVLGGDK